MTDFILENAMAEGKKHKIVAIGYVQYKKVRERADRLLKYVSRKNFGVHHAGMMIVRIPPRKLERILTEFPEIQEHKAYWQCKYKWIEDEDESFELPKNIHRLQ